MSLVEATIQTRRRPSALLPPVFMKLPGSGLQPWVPRFEDHFEHTCASNAPSGRAWVVASWFACPVAHSSPRSPVTSDCASSLLTPPSPLLIFNNANFLDLTLEDDLPTVRASSFVFVTDGAASRQSSPVASISAFAISSQRRRSSTFQVGPEPALFPTRPDSPIVRTRQASLEIKVNKRSEPIGAGDVSACSRGPLVQLMRVRLAGPRIVLWIVDGMCQS